MYSQSGWAPSERTLQRHFVHLELDRVLTRRLHALRAQFPRVQGERFRESRQDRTLNYTIHIIAIPGAVAIA
jgi:hypothetical protein